LRFRLSQIRAAIKEVAPDAPERISYGMPCYGEKGRTVYFGIAKAHIGLFGISASILEQHKDEVADFVAEKSTVRLPLDRELPIELIKELVRARMGNT